MRRKRLPTAALSVELTGKLDPAANRSGAADFSEWVRGWIHRIDEGRESLTKSFHALARLTLDLENAAWLRRESPMLVRLLSRGWYDDPSLRASRRGWLKRRGGHALIPELLDFWRRHTRRLVPDPKNAESSNYDSCIYALI